MRGRGTGGSITLVHIEEEKWGDELVEALRVLDRPPLAVDCEELLKVGLHLVRLELVDRLPRPCHIRLDRLLVLGCEPLAGRNFEVGPLVVHAEEDLSVRKMQVIGGGIVSRDVPCTAPIAPNPADALGVLPVHANAAGVRC